MLMPDDPDETPKRPRGSLSDAAEQAKKTPEDQEVIRSQEKRKKADREREAEEDEVGIDDVIVAILEDPTTTTGEVAASPVAAGGGESTELERMHLGAVGGIATEAGGVFDRIGFGGLEWGFRAERRLRLNVQLLFFDPSLDENRGLHESLEHLQEIGLDVSPRFYFTPDHTFAGVYALLGYRIGYFSWDYVHAIRVVNDDGSVENIGSDAIFTHVFQIGLGVSPVQLKHVHIGGNVSYGIKLYMPTTRENFDNDLFRAVGAGRLSIDLAYVF